MAAKALIVISLAACAAASGESYQRVWRQDGYDRVPTEYGVRVNGYNAYIDDPKFGRLGKRDASGESFQYVSRVDGYDQVPTEYGVQVNGYNAHVDEDRVGRLGKRSTYEHTPALAYHPAGGYGYNTYGAGTSYVDRSPQGLHKRSTYGYTPALAYHPAGGYGYNKYGSGTSYVYRSPQGLHKRDASGESFQTVERSNCYGYNCENSEYKVEVNGYNSDVNESRDGKNYAFQYGFNN